MSTNRRSPEAGGTGTPRGLVSVLARDNNRSVRTAPVAPGIAE